MVTLKMYSRNSEQKVDWAKWPGSLTFSGILSSVSFHLLKVLETSPKAPTVVDEITFILQLKRNIQRKKSIEKSH